MCNLADSRRPCYKKRKSIHSCLGTRRQFIHDPRYALLPSLDARKEVFDEYCKEAIRKQKEEKAKSGTYPLLVVL